MQSGGLLYIRSGDSETTVLDGGGEQLLSRGQAYNTTLHGGSLSVSRDAFAVGALVGGGGRVLVYAGGEIDRVTLTGGAHLAVASGAIVNSANLGSGTEVVAAGGIILATTAFGAHATLAVAPKAGASVAVSGFRATDTIDMTNFRFGAALKHSFVEKEAKTSGILTITEGALKVSVPLFGQYTAAGFHFGKDGAGTAITYSAPSSAHVDLAGGHS